MQIKSTVRYHFIVTRITIIKNRDNKYGWGGEIGTPGIASKAATIENSLVFPQNVNMEVPYGPAILIARYIPKRNEMLCPHQTLYMNAHNSIIHNSCK